ncbi:MAG: alpha/beta hydrolase, partial [Pseudomonadota bacterium]
MPILTGIDFEEGGEGASVIAMHGIGGGPTSFADQIGALPARVIAWAMPGYRNSPPDELTFENLAARLAAFMDALGLERAHLLGHSIGGMVAQEFAARHPDRTASLVLIGTTPSFGGRDPAFAEAFLEARLAPLDAGATMAEIAEASAPNICGPGASAEVFAKVAAPMAATPEATWRAVLKCLTTFNRRDDIAAMTMPTCLIAGTDDKNAPARTMEKMAAQMPDAEYHLLDGVGHMINQEAPETV